MKERRMVRKASMLAAMAALIGLLATVLIAATPAEFPVTSPRTRSWDRQISLITFPIG